MEDNPSIIESLFDKTEHFTKKSIELIKLKAIDKFAEVISSLVSLLAFVVFVLLFFLILNIGIALWIGDMLGKSYYGFFILSGFYACMGVVFYSLRHKIVKAPVRNSIIVQSLN